ncbi:MAG: peptidoglycan DD-metalloendopeptidase family protein [Defluviitaleaceae bacterium]|nr:peptidoglycan DD-metalloendopeptidase family protein [Defluviitaleaceae bacterium]
MKSKLFFLSGFLSFVLMFIIFFDNGAYASGDNAARLGEITSQIEVVQSSVYDVNQRMSETQQEIYQIEEEIRQVEEELDIINAQLDTTKETLRNVELDLEEAKELRTQQQETFIARARVMYMNGATTYLDVLLGASDFTDLLMRMEFINIIIEHDQNLVRNLLDTEQRISESQAIIESEAQRLMSLELQEMARRSEHESNLEAWNLRLDGLEREEREFLEQLRALEQSQREVENLIRAQARQARATQGASTNRVVDPALLNLSGRMAWPVPGHLRISSPYGPRRSPISGRNEFHSGIDIPAPAGRDIISSDHGVVIFSGWQNGYGNTVIVDHGDGITTLYAHNSRNLVRVGQSVQQGQVIAAIGTTGWSTGNHTHFEVRHNGRHTDPMSFLR